MNRHAAGQELPGDRRGYVMILVAVVVFVLIGFAALAIDTGHLFVVRNELKNAADAGALAGARILYIDNGAAVNPEANQSAYDAAVANRSEKLAVEVGWSEGNSGDVERGHWSFSTRTFTPNGSLLPVDLWDLSSSALDGNLDFINAVRVRTRRESTPAASFFARIFGLQNFGLSAESVAYIGFAGSILPEDVDQPIAICQQAILNAQGAYTCGVGRMINSGLGNAGHQTGGWTNFTQPCLTASASTVRPYVCGQGNPIPIAFGQGMGTNGGEIEAAFNDLASCWIARPGLDTNADGWPDRPWTLTLPVIDCPGNNTGNCSIVTGVVTLNILWITRNDKNQFKEVPRNMQVTLDGVTTTFTCPEPTPGQECWSRFVTTFNLQDVLNGTQATYEDKTIYFLPDCNPHIPIGASGGNNYGVLARTPKLVQ